MTYTCKHCHHTWTPRKEGRPVSCPACKSYRWDKEKNTGTKTDKKED